MTPVDVGTLVHPGVILDAETVEELTSRCDATSLAGDRCAAEALWMFRFAPTCSCGTPVALTCGPHRDSHVGSDWARWVCALCGSRCRLVAVTPLR